MNDPKRILQRARKRGDLPVSRSFLSAAGLLAVGLVAPSWLSQTWAGARRNLEESLEQILIASEAPDPRALLDVRSGALVESVARPVLTLSAVLVVAVLIAGLAQTRGATVIRDKDTMARPPRARSGFGLLMPVGLLAVSASVVIGHLDLWSTTALLSSSDWAPFGALLGKLALAGVMVALALGAIDVWWVRILWRKRNEMPPAERRREQRQQEAPPEVRAVQREIHREMAAGGS